MNASRAHAMDLTSCGALSGHDNAAFPGEQLLLAQLREGDERAYDLLVRQQSGRMLAVARRMLGCESDANDAVQDAFVSAFKAIGSFAGESSIGTWLHRILTNACLMKIRSRGSRQTISIDDSLPAFDETGHHVRSISRWHATPDELLARSEMCTQVRQLIDQLPDAFRIVLVLRDIEELDTDQTAKALGISTGAVKVRLHRARQALRTLLEPLIEYDGPTAH